MTDRSFLILHGIENHRPPAHWQFWLAARLAEQGSQVLYPDLPNADTPRYEEWETRLFAGLDELSGASRVVVCYSLACLLWFRAASAIPAPLRPDRLLLVAPPDSALVPEAGASFRLDELDSTAVRASATEEIRIVCSERDPYNAVGAAAMYARPLGASVDLLPGAGHITPDDGYGAWPCVLAWCNRR